MSMGEAKRKREAAYRDGPWPGNEGRCPPMTKDGWCRQWQLKQEVIN